MILVKRNINFTNTNSSVKEEIFLLKNYIEEFRYLMERKFTNLKICIVCTEFFVVVLLSVFFK